MFFNVWRFDLNEKFLQYVYFYIYKNYKQLINWIC